MSRSRKKVGVIKDKGCDSSFYNRRFRRINRQRIQLSQEPLLLAEVVNSYIICDYKLRFTPHLDASTSNKRQASRLWLDYYGK